MVNVAPLEYRLALGMASVSTLNDVRELPPPRKEPAMYTHPYILQMLVAAHQQDLLDAARQAFRPKSLRKKLNPRSAMPLPTRGPHGAALSKITCARTRQSWSFTE